MKKVLIAAALLCSAFSVFAQTNTNVNSSTQAGANNAGNAQDITINQAATVIPTTTTQNINGSETVRNVPSVSGPNLTSSNDTFMGSTSGSANGPGFGVSIGSTWADNNCKMLKNSRELWNMGMKAAALALMCTDPANKDALELTGFVCPQTAKAKQAAQTQAQSNEKYTDPIVRARLGLPPLASK